MVKNTADKLNAALSELADKGETRPIFIVSHLPLHYSSRSESTDNQYAGYIFDAISENSTLNIVYLFGHNHSGTYDDYIGGSINYLEKGSAIHIGGTNEERKLGFTYTNCGYIGYTANSENDASINTLSATIITVSSSEMIVKKYTPEGVSNQYEIPLINTLKKVA